MAENQEGGPVHAQDLCRHFDGASFKIHLRFSSSPLCTFLGAHLYHHRQQVGFVTRQAGAKQKSKLDIKFDTYRLLIPALIQDPFHSHSRHVHLSIIPKSF